MKASVVTVVAGVVMTAAQEAVALVDHLNTWVELVIKVGGAAAAVGAAWRWLVGPGYRNARRWVEWVRDRLELITKVDRRLDGIDDRLEHHERHFKKVDSTLDVLRDDYVKEARAALREGRPVRLTEAGAPERRQGA